MSITADARRETVETHRRHDSDSGSAEVQIALLTRRIEALTEHVRTHRHDFSSRRGLLMLVGRRNRLLRYLNRTEHDRYLELIKKLGLRK